MIQETSSAGKSLLYQRALGPGTVSVGVVYQEQEQGQGCDKIQGRTGAVFVDIRHIFSGGWGDGWDGGVRSPELRKKNQYSGTCAIHVVDSQKRFDVQPTSGLLHRAL